MMVNDVQNIPREKHEPSPQLFTSSSSSSTCPIHYVETTTNQVVYPRLFFNLDTAITSHTDLLNLPVLLYLVNRMDTVRYSAEEIEIMESGCCGGISMGVGTYDEFHGDLTRYRNVRKRMHK